MIENGNLPPVTSPVWKDLAIPIETLPNLRRVDSRGKLYRSSRQDLLSRADTEKLKELRIQSVIDFRSKSEYKVANGDKIYDQNSTILEVVIPKAKGSGQSTKQISVNVKPVKSLSGFQNKEIKNSQTLSDNHSAINRKRFLLDFFKLHFVWTVFNRIPLYKRLFSILYLIVDILFRTHFRYFIRYFAKETLNPAGLLSSYIDMIELSGTQICLALRILSDPSNLPALVSCAHGKDRTGIVVAMVLSLLGKSDDYIAEEYALSEIGLDPIRPRVHQEIVGRTRMDESFTHARRETMDGLLQYIHKTYGSVPNYLESIGFGKEDQKKLLQSFQE
ncbi:uncharacterized protein LOC121409660 [Lytechinus variegatus]|uniref:uncharacterized protein LOC121409660 n=1 Tax=Lytechinus variegatus TaxID=7654 RepID=UPI001BB166BA|nr:uncharacterized protein LOC121409660 [Lytechinus variegatus]